MGVGQASWGWRKSLPIVGKSSLVFRSDTVGGGDKGLSRLLTGKIGESGEEANREWFQSLKVPLRRKVLGIRP